MFVSVYNKSLSEKVNNSVTLNKLNNLLPEEMLLKEKELE